MEQNDCDKSVCIQSVTEFKCFCVLIDKILNVFHIYLLDLDSDKKDVIAKVFLRYVKTNT